MGPSRAALRPARAGVGWRCVLSVSPGPDPLTARKAVRRLQRPYQQLWHSLPPHLASATAPRNGRSHHARHHAQATLLPGARWTASGWPFSAHVEVRPVRNDGGR